MRQHILMIAGSFRPQLETWRYFGVTLLGMRFHRMAFRGQIALPSGSHCDYGDLSLHLPATDEVARREQSQTELLAGAGSQA